MCRNLGMQPHPRPHLCQTPNHKQRHRSPRTPHAPSNYKRIPHPIPSPPLRLDSPKPLARSNTPPLRWPARILSALLHGPFNGLRHRCFWYLFCVGLDCRFGFEVLNEYFFAAKRCACYRCDWVWVGICGVCGYDACRCSYSVACYEVWVSMASTVYLYEGCLSEKCLR
jgi:hypothetical protein